MAEAGEQSSGGLVKSNGQSLPLRSLVVEGDVKGYILGLQARLSYENDDKDPVEVMFRMPLESTQAVVGLTAVVDGRKIIAELQEKEEARTAYDDAIASGQTSALGEQKSDDVFSILLGNLPGGGQAEIQLQMVSEIPIDAEGMLRFSLPTTLKSRYSPPQSTAVDVLSPVQGDVESGKLVGVQQFQLRVHNTSNISDVNSQTHSIVITPSEEIDALVVTLAEGQSLFSDLVIQISHKSPHIPTAIVEAGVAVEKDKMPTLMNHPAVMVNFLPIIPQVDMSCEFIFLVDRSGSMSGSFIKSASETLVLFLKSLPEGSYFNIYGFGSRFESLFSSSVLYTQDNLVKATNHAQNLKANLGGTEILPPLREIFNQPEISGIPRQIFILTDGAVSNTTECIDEVGKNSHKARCFTFGIGSGASSALVNGMAKAGRGTAEFVKEGERMQPKVIRTLKHALQPALTDVTLSFELPSDINVLKAPKDLFSLFNGEKLVVYGILESKHGQTLDKEVTGKVFLRGSLLGEVILHSLEFQCNPTFSMAALLPIHHLATKRLIEDLEYEQKPKEEIVKLSIDGGVISSETAFIAVDQENSKPITGSMKTFGILPTEALSHQAQVIKQLIISQLVTRGERLDSLDCQTLSLQSSSQAFYKSSHKSGGGWMSSLGSAVSSVVNWFRSDTKSVGSTRESSEQSLDSTSERARNLLVLDGDIEETENNKTHTSTCSTSINAIIALQQANGSWLLDDTFAQAIGITLNVLESSRPTECDTTIWATVLALVALRVKFSSERDEWELIANKSETWLKGQTLGSNLSDLYDSAESLITS